VADNLLREIARIALTIREFPKAGRSRDEVRAGIRSISASPHIVFYRLKGDQPEIVRVLDGRQDIDEIFSGEADG
jgi:toxin ParE1/3/4